MALFWKPGAPKPDAPPSLEVDRDGDGGTDVSHFNRFGGLSLRDQRERLPVFKHRNAFLFLVETHATTVVVGQTGSGKTTQIPQYLMEAGWTAGGRQVACTQPRRIAAQTVAARVAEEAGVTLGAEVGYAIRFEDVTTPNVTRIKYLTDGVLLREMMEDPLLLHYSVIMVDEAHERSVATDVLLGLLKKVQKKRPDLRLIIASATLAASEIAAFFNTSKDRSAKTAALGGGPNQMPAVLSVEGRSFPVEIHYLEEPSPDYLQTAVTTVLAIHKQEGPGDVLVFLTGQDEVDTVVDLLTDEAQHLRHGLVALPLYAGLPKADQEAALGSTGRGKRKVIVATNIAETSLTMEGVVYVVDCGFSKQRFYNPMADMEVLVVAPIARASAIQRAGRAGRVRPGKCYRLYTEEAYEEQLAAVPVPEIQRSNLAPTVLQLKALGIDNIMRFDWLAPPPAEAMLRALEILYALEVLDSDARLAKPQGVQLAEVPLEPMAAKMLLAGGKLGCSEETLTIAACLCVQSVWQGSSGRTKEFDNIRARFAVAEGDHLTWLNVLHGFEKAGQSGRWCHENFVNYRALLRVLDVRAQLQRLLQRLGMPLVSCGRDTLKIRKAVTSGFFAHAAQLQGDTGTYATLRGQHSLKIHPSSVLFRVTPKWVVFNSVSVAEVTYMRDVAAIDPAWLTEVAPHFYGNHRRAIR